MRVLPNGFNWALHQLALRDVEWPSSPSGSFFHFSPAMARGAFQAARYEYLAWTHFVQGMLDAYGREAVAAKLDAEWVPLVLGYQGFALNLYATGALTRDAIEAELVAYMPADLKGATLHRGQESSGAPGLEAQRLKSGAAKGAGHDFDTDL